MTTLHKIALANELLIFYELYRNVEQNLPHFHVATKSRLDLISNDTKNLATQKFLTVSSS